MTAAHSHPPYDLICIGAGPTGLACAIEAKRAGLRPLVIDKGCLCNSLYHYPTNMVFFTTPERMEIGDLPMTTLGGKPTRAEALKYYRRAAEHYALDVVQYQFVERISGADGAFTVSARSATARASEIDLREGAAFDSACPDARREERSATVPKQARGSGVLTPEAGRSASLQNNASDSENNLLKGTSLDPACPDAGMKERSASLPKHARSSGVLAPEVGRSVLRRNDASDSENDLRQGTVSTVPNDTRSSGASAPEVGRGAPHEYRARKLVLATGYYDLPNFLNVPGEDLPHVSHYFTDAHPYWDKDVVVIGAKNSAAEAALDLFRGGARVTLIHRGAELGRSLKYWVRPDIENRIRAGEIAARFSAKVVRFEPGKVVIHNGGGPEELPAFHAFAMTGYHPDFQFLESAGVRLDAKTRKPEVNAETLETNVPGIYVAGVLVGGLHTGEIFIENGRFHGRQIIAAIAGREGPREPAPVAPPGE